MDPFSLYNDWLELARASGKLDAKAASLATVDAEGAPSARMVLIQYADERGFTFFTNLKSRKARDLSANQRAAMCLYWPLIDRQVRIEGAVEQIPDDEADAYFASRPRESQLGAWASKQSAALEADDALVKRYEEYAAQYEGQAVPRPPFWSGYRLVPRMIEFWTAKPGRLHDRLRFDRDGAAWKASKLYP